MKRKQKKINLVTFFLTLLVFLIQKTKAEDIEIFTSKDNTTKELPNVMLIVDTSESSLNGLSASVLEQTSSFALIERFIEEYHEKACGDFALRRFGLGHDDGDCEERRL